MDFLALCQRTAAECAIPNSSFASVTGQTGIKADIVRWVNMAYEDIQRDSIEWYFRQADKSFSTIANVAQYVTQMADVSAINKDTVTLDTAHLIQLPYLDFKYLYEGATPKTGKPIHYAVAPDNSFRVGPTPDTVYTISFQYSTKVVSLVNNTDTPIIPAEYHMAIVWKAAAHFAGYEESGFQYQIFNDKYKELFSRLYREQRVTIGTTGQALGDNTITNAGFWQYI